MRILSAFLRPALRAPVKNGVFATSGLASRRIANTARLTAKRIVPVPSFFGLAFALLAIGAPALASGASTVEPATGIAFENDLHGASLVGVGVRYKWGLVKIYAVSFTAASSNVKRVSQTGNLTYITLPMKLRWFHSYYPLLCQLQ